MKNKRYILSIFILLGLLVPCSGDNKDEFREKKKETVLPVHLRGEQWIRHFKEDLLPYWNSPEAKGEPQGNFPTFRGMDGRLITEVKNGKDPNVRYPRMLARQVYLYSIGYLLTGDAQLLQLAEDGCDWLAKHAWDKKNGGWFGVLEKSGKAIPGEVKYAQDTSYVAQAFAAYYFVTRDPEFEKYILETRDLIFGKYWDEKNKRVFDAMNETLTKEVDQGNDKGWELVAQLDQINAFMMLAQPVLNQKQRRIQFLKDMHTLGDTMVRHFLENGIFWGIHNNKGKYDTRHVDFGHTLKAYWMLYLLEQRLPDHPYEKIVNKYMNDWLNLAFDKKNGTWGEKMLMDKNGKLYAQYGSLWWSYAELDQVAATLNMADGTINTNYTEKLTRTAKHWLEGFVDKQYKEVYFSIKRNGSRGWNWKADDIMKCFLWKNGFHSAEHALVMYIHGRTMEKKPVELFFAVPPGVEKTFAAIPYIFKGKEKKRDIGLKMKVDEKELMKVKVVFDSVGR